jgi:hypothetical protein
VGERFEHPALGPAYRRTFRGVGLNTALEEELQRAQDSGDIAEFRRDGKNLIVVRRWVEGIDFRSTFTKAPATDRKIYSFELFSNVLDKLGGLPHGALHPQNVWNLEGQPLALLDRVANAARLGALPESAATYETWLWGARIPAGWDVHAWDLVNLLRMAALLAEGPSRWKCPLPFPEALQLCRRWAKEFLDTLMEGDDREKKITEALQHLDEIHPLPAVDIEWLARAEELLDEVLAHRGDRMLRTDDEERLAEQIRSDGDEIDHLVAVALHRSGAAREEDLEKTAVGFLRAGIYAGSLRWVRSSACRNAERLFLGLGVPREEAERRVQRLLKELNFIDSRAEQNIWSRAVDEYLQKHCRSHRYSSRQLKSMVELVIRYDLPKQWAEPQVRQYLEQRGYFMRYPWL